VKKYSFTEEQLLSLIQMALEIGRGEAPKTGPLTVDWPQRLLRHAIRNASGRHPKLCPGLFFIKKACKVIIPAAPNDIYSSIWLFERGGIPYA
jgi:hypothetical protein